MRLIFWLMRMWIPWFFDHVDTCVVTGAQTKSAELEKGLLVDKTAVTHIPNDFYESDFNLEEFFE